MVTTVYGPSTVKRTRRNKDQLADLDDAIVTAVADEHPVTLRGVFYRVVSAGAVDKTELGYRTVGRRLLALRRDGQVPYSWITDGTRWISKPDTFSGIDEMLEDAAASYRRALWHDHDVEVQIYSEKDAITGVILPVTQRWDVPLGVTRGYASESFAWGVAESIRSAHWAGKEVFVYDLGDHDPSGVDAWRAFEQRVTDFVCTDARSRPGWTSRAQREAVHFERLAVTPEQVEEYQLPTRFTKSGDTRAKGFTGGSVEVDAIRPSILRSLVEQAITQHIDPEKLRVTRIAEESERDILTRMATGWSA
jgi:hypothetical protein